MVFHHNIQKAADKAIYDALEGLSSSLNLVLKVGLKEVLKEDNLEKKLLLLDEGDTLLMNKIETTDLPPSLKTKGIIALSATYP